MIEAISDYGGAVILVSHDRHLLEACADRLWLVSGGEVQPFDGDMADYQRLVLSAPGKAGAAEERSAESEGAPASRGAQRRAAAGRRIDPAPLRRRITEKRRPPWPSSTRRSPASTPRWQPASFARDPVQAASLAKGRAEAASALEKAEEEWLAASAEHEAAS